MKPTHALVCTATRAIEGGEPISGTYYSPARAMRCIAGRGRSGRRQPLPDGEMLIRAARPLMLPCRMERAVEERGEVAHHLVPIRLVEYLVTRARIDARFQPIPADAFDGLARVRQWT